MFSGYIAIGLLISLRFRILACSNYRLIDILVYFLMRLLTTAHKICQKALYVYYSSEFDLPGLASRRLRVVVNSAYNNNGIVAGCENKVLPSRRSNIRQDDVWLIQYIVIMHFSGLNDGMSSVRK